MTAENISSEFGYYDDADIAKLLGISVGRLRNKISAGDPLPIRLRPEGCYKRLWPRQSVHDWLEKYREQDVGHRRPGFRRQAASCSFPFTCQPSVGWISLMSPM